ncbi:MAG: hypothetical protein S4CHLAM37_01310 [Chlamydiia bacterium]|nr:hypothetical protein [Chlamydiia bacterium]
MSTNSLHNCRYCGHVDQAFDNESRKLSPDKQWSILDQYQFLFRYQLAHYYAHKMNCTNYPNVDETPFIHQKVVNVGSALTTGNNLPPKGRPWTMYEVSILSESAGYWMGKKLPIPWEGIGLSIHRTGEECRATYSGFFKANASPNPTTTHQKYTSRFEK